MRTAVYGTARIGGGRELKWALEDYWAGRSTEERLSEAAAGIRRSNWRTLAAAGVSFVPSNDFSLYDHVLDAAVALGAVPARFGPLRAQGSLERYFAMARGAELDGVAVAPLELTKWFDTNYHQLVPEIDPGTAFAPDASKTLGELEEAAAGASRWSRSTSRRCGKVFRSGALTKRGTSPGRPVRFAWPAPPRARPPRSTPTCATRSWTMSSTCWRSSTWTWPPSRRHVRR